MNKEVLKNIRVLYAEDEIDVREFTRKTIDSLVKDIVVVENGLQGLELFKDDNNFDLIVTDINMPKMGGLEMCTEIKKLNPHIPIVITSAHNDPAFLKKAIEVGVTAYAMKPIDLYQLIESMIKAVEPIFLKKELEKVNDELKNLNMSLEEKIAKSIKQIKSILDSQDNIIVVTGKEKIDEVNKRFHEFFNTNSLEDFFKDHNCIEELFVKEEGFFHAGRIRDNKNWIEAILELQEIERIVKFKDLNGSTRIFMVHIDNYEHEGEHYVVSFTDITEIKEKSKLLEYQASHDILTGLYNRQKFHDIFKKEIKRDRRYNNHLSLIVFDIDRFKSFNDRYGHDAGDDVLRSMAKVVKDSVREHDIVVRWGGEEFLVLLPETNVGGAVSVAEKIRFNIENFEHKKIPETITASFGVTVLLHDDNENTFIKRADEALYKAKQTGRNKVITNL